MNVFKIINQINEEDFGKEELPQEQPVQKKDRYPQRKPLMRVKELIAKLQQQDQEAEVLVFCNEDYGDVPANAKIASGTAKELDEAADFASDGPGMAFNHSLDKDRKFIMIMGLGPKD